MRREGEEGEGGKGRGGCSGRIAKEGYMWLLAHIGFVCMYVVVYFTISTVWTRVNYVSDMDVKEYICVATIRTLWILLLLTR